MKESRLTILRVEDESGMLVSVRLIHDLIDAEVAQGIAAERM